MQSAVTFAIASDRDIGSIRTTVRGLAGRLGFAAAAQIAIVTAVSELGHNILESGGGQLVLSMVQNPAGGKGIQAVGQDRRSGAADSPDGEQGGSGPRLSGARRIVDEFEVASPPEGGTTVTLRMWRRA